MARPVLIIEFGADAVRAGLFEAGKLAPLNFFSKPSQGDMRTAFYGLLDAIRSYGFDAFSRVAVSLPADMVNIRVITLPFSDVQKIKEVISFETRELFIKDSEELVLEMLRMSDGKILVAAVEKEALRQFAAMLNDASIYPVWFGLSLFSKDRLVKKLYAGDDTSAFLDVDCIVAVKGPQACFFKRIKDVKDVKLALSYAHASGFDIKRIFASPLASAMAVAAGVDVTLTDEYTDENNGLVAMAMQLKEGLKNAVNFRIGEFAGMAEYKAAKGLMKAAVVMAVLLLGLSVSILYLGHKIQSASLERLNASLENGYHELFKGEAKAVDPLYQLEAKLKTLKDEEQALKDGVDVLRVMNELALSVNKSEKLRLYKLEMHPGMVSANGETVSFESASEFKNILSKRGYFKDVSLTDVKSKADGGVSFSISMSFREVV